MAGFVPKRGLQEGVCRMDPRERPPSSLDEADGDKRSPKLVQFLENAIRETIDKEKKKFKSVLGYAK